MDPSDPKSSPTTGRFVPWVAATTAVVVAVVAGALVLARPPGHADPDTAALDAIENEDARDPAVLARQRWGEGMLVLTRHEDAAGRHLALAFVIDQGRGWRAAGRTEDRADPDDVVLGSLLVATSEGGAGQPPWSAAYGEVTDDRIQRVEVAWADEERTEAELTGTTYLVVRAGTVDVTSIRYLDEEGTEIATVPVT